MQSACSTSAPAPRSRCFSTTLDYSRCRFPLAAVRTPSSNTSRTSRVSDAVHRHARLVPCARGGGAGGPERVGDRRGSTQEGRGRPGPRRLETREIVQLALPAVGLVALASVVAPLVAGLVVSTLAISAAAVAAAVALSLTWTLAPLFIGLFGLPLLIFGGFFAGLFIVPSLIQLALLGGALWVGSSLARTLLFGPGPPEQDAFGGTIDTEATTIEDWKEEINIENRQREEELREFDEMLRRRERFRNRS